MWEWIIRIMKKIRFWILHSTKIINGTLTGRIDNVRAGKVYGFNSFPFLCHLCNNLRNGVCCIVYGRVCGGNDHFIIYCIFFFQPETGSISGNVGSILWTPICIYTYILFQNERHVDMNICICTIYISVWTAKNLIFTALVDFYIFVIFFSHFLIHKTRETKSTRVNHIILASLHSNGKPNDTEEKISHSFLRMMPVHTNSNVIVIFKIFPRQIWRTCIVRWCKRIYTGSKIIKMYTNSVFVSSEIWKNAWSKINCWYENVHIEKKCTKTELKSLTATTICTIQCTATFLFTLLLAKTMFELFISDMIKQRWKDRMTFMNAMRLLMSSPSLIQTFIILLDKIKMHWQCSSIYCNTLKLRYVCGASQPMQREKRVIFYLKFL